MELTESIGVDELIGVDGIDRIGKIRLYQPKKDILSEGACQ